MNSSLYRYHLPKNLIAKQPAVPRDNSRLFVYNTLTNEVTFSRFSDLDKFLPEKSFLVLNNTKVLPARIELKKVNGGKVICLFLFNELKKIKNKNVIKIYVDRKIGIGDKLFIDPSHNFTVINQNNEIFTLEYNFSNTTLLKLLDEKGKTPIPLYLRKTNLPENEIREKYQTIFAKNIGSVAAPTASLHFTEDVFTKLKNKNINKYEITLHVGRGTFAPIDNKNIEQKKLHEEYFTISRSNYKKLNKLKSEGYKLISAGTTTVRALETAVQHLRSVTDYGKASKTTLFILPPFDFKMVDILITNFHLPGSSLMMLVEAFLQYKNAKKHLIDLHRMAIREKFRFYSFGDAMLIL